MISSCYRYHFYTPDHSKTPQLFGVDITNNDTFILLENTDLADFTFDKLFVRRSVSRSLT